MIDFTGPKVKRARLTNFRTKEFLEFHLNPSPLKHTYGAHFAEDAVPGFSHPLRRWTSGKAEGLAFKLNLDGDISFRVFGVVLDNPLNPTSQQQPFSVEGFVDWLFAFNAPTDPLIDVGGNGGNDTAVFNFGLGYKNWPCDIEVTDIEKQEWDSNLICTKAVAEIKLTKRVITSETYSKRWQVFA